MSISIVGGAGVFNWEAIGAVGEIAGAIGVIVTLVYLTSQLRQNTRALRSTTVQAYNERTDSFWDFQAQHAAVLGRFAEHQSFGELTSEEKMIVDAMLMKSFNLLEATLLHHRAGAMGEEEFHAKRDGFRRAFQNPMTKEGWERLGPTMAFTDTFKQFMHEEIFPGNGTTDESYFSRFQTNT